MCKESAKGRTQTFKACAKGKCGLFLICRTLHKMAAKHQNPSLASKKHPAKKKKFDVRTINIDVSDIFCCI